MCGIVGYIGNREASNVLLDGLQKLEYRGYDSAGICVRDGEKPAEVVKAKGRISNLIAMTDNGETLKGNCGIGHTRWATHGEPSMVNAHPHVSGNCTNSGSGIVESNVVGVHNGIIENYQELKDKLLRNGYTFYSDTDTEVAVKLVDYYYRKYLHTPEDAIGRTMVRVRGTFAFEIMFKDRPNEVWIARKDSPMIVGKGENELFVASDVSAIINHTRDVYYIDNMELAQLKPSGEVHFFDVDGVEHAKELTTVEWDSEQAEKGGFEHFMIKEIHEQPEVVKKTLSIALNNEFIDSDLLRDTEQVYIVACGTASHAGYVGQYVIEDLCRIPVRVEMASEYRYRSELQLKNTLMVIISQSGETADTLAALRIAKERGIKTLAIVNVVGSSIAREADFVLYTLAGPEIAVASTKAYTCQLMAMYVLALQMAKVKETISNKEYDYYIEELKALPEKMSKVLEAKERIQWFASKFANAKDMFYIGRGMDYAIAMEGSLKLKEVSYIHSEAYAAGELKHGTISLIENGTLVVGICTQSGLYEKTRSNMVETKARGAYLMGLTTAGNYSIEDSSNFAIYVPRTDEHLTAILAIIPLQLFSYYITVAKGLDVDKPRNLAKSVTVE